jgi:hypothetical protein
VITTIKASNVDAYKLLFEEASDILSGYKAVRTYSPNTEYYYKQSGANKGYQPYVFESEDDSERLVQFGNSLANEDGLKIYIKIKDEPVGGFAPELGITTLEEYFNWLPDLKSIVAEENGEEVIKPTKFTVLPLDEDHFHINANTRAINIPPDFKKNGIAVQSDDLAEVVYFEIDRYFDAVDLNTQNIFIEWEDAEGVPGFSREYVRDIESEPNYLIFGWALAKDITQHPGKVRFSIRFYTFDDRSEENKLIYSFST